MRRRRGNDGLGWADDARPRQPDVRLIVWCKGCGHQVEPDIEEQVERYGEHVAVPDWASRLRLLAVRRAARSISWSAHRESRPAGCYVVARSVWPCGLV